MTTTSPRPGVSAVAGRHRHRQVATARTRPNFGETLKRVIISLPLPHCSISNVCCYQLIFYVFCHHLFRGWGNILSETCSQAIFIIYVQILCRGHSWNILRCSSPLATVWSGLYHQHFECSHSSLQVYFWAFVLSNLAFWPLNNLISTQDRTVLSGLKFTRKCTSLPNLWWGTGRGPGP